METRNAERDLIERIIREHAAIPYAHGEIDRIPEGLRRIAAFNDRRKIENRKTFHSVKMYRASAENNLS